MKLRKIPCPCGGCKKFILDPLFGCQCSSVREEDADQLIAALEDAERFEFLMSNPQYLGALPFQKKAKRREWIDEKRFSKREKRDAK